MEELAFRPASTPVIFCLKSASADGTGVAGGVFSTTVESYSSKKPTALGAAGTSYRTTPSSGELAVAYSFLGIRPARYA